MTRDTIREMAAEQLDAAVTSVLEREIEAMARDGASEATILLYLANRSRQLEAWRMETLASIVASVTRQIEHPDVASTAVH